MEIILLKKILINFRIYDDYGDGICCSSGSGYYKLTTDQSVVMVNQTTFNGYYDSYTFSLGTLLAAEDVKKGNVEKLVNNQHRTFSSVNYFFSNTTHYKSVKSGFTRTTNNNQINVFFFSYFQDSFSW